MSAEVSQLRCAHCGVVIGVYEPVIVIHADGRSEQRSWSEVVADARLRERGSAPTHASCAAHHSFSSSSASP